MILINSGKLTIPEDERFIGYAGDNLHSQKQFLLKNVTNENCLYRLYLQFDDGTVNYFVLDSLVENGSTILTWNILEEHIFKSGIVSAQIKAMAQNGEIYHTSWDYFYVEASAEFSGEFKGNENAEFLRYEKELNEIYQKINETDLSSFVSFNRKVAGYPLSHDISVKNLWDALKINPPIFKAGAPTPLNSGLYHYLIDTENNDLYYCDKTISNNRYNWIKLTGENKTNDGITPDLLSYAQKIQDAQSPSTLTLALMSDPHYCDNDTNAKDKLKAAQTMAKLCDYVQLDAIGNLGDMVRGDEIKATTRNDLAKLIVNTQKNAKCPIFYVRGNHDDNGWYSYEGAGTSKRDEMINDKEWYQQAFSFSAKDVVTDPNKPHGGYGYFDHKASKIRVFLLNTSDIPYVTNDDGTYRYNSYQCLSFSNEQLNFVANSLQFSDKENPNEWAAMFLMHIPLDTTNDNGYRFGGLDALLNGHTQMLSIIKAYKNGTSYSYNGSTYHPQKGEQIADFLVDVNVDYSKKGVGDVICFLSGHTHTDNASRQVGYDTSLSYGYTYLGIVGETGFATLVIDREQSTVSVFKYGAVKTQADMESNNPGAINGEEELGLNMKSGAWVVEFDQFRPTDDNLYNGLSELWGSGYEVDNTATINPDTLELSAATPKNEYYKLSKGVLTKSSTQYKIPSDSAYTIACFNKDTLTFNGVLTPTTVEGADYKVITTKPSANYLVFGFHTVQNPDYENFYIKEMGGE